MPDSTGYYFFGGVNAGTWNLLVHAQASAYRDTSFTATVSTEAVTNAGTTTLSGQ